MNAKYAHIIGQVLATIAQIMMQPSEKLFGWSPELSEFLHAALSASQTIAGIVAVFLDPNKKPE